MSDKTTLIVTSIPNPEQQAALDAYVQGAYPLLLNLGGEIVKRSVVSDTYHGEQNFKVIMLMDFPSKSALLAMFDSSAYQALIPDRNKAFKSIEIMFADHLE